MKPFGIERREEEPAYSLDHIQAVLEELSQALQTAKDDCSRLAIEFKIGAINAHEYNSQLDTIERNVSQLEINRSKLLRMIDAKTRHLGRRALDS